MGSCVLGKAITHHSQGAYETPGFERLKTCEAAQQLVQMYLHPHICICRQEYVMTASCYLLDTPGI